MSKPIKIRIYLDDGRISCYEVGTQEKAREHVQAIARKNGYRCATEKGWTFYPLHRIDKIKADGVESEHVAYWEST